MILEAQISISDGDTEIGKVGEFFATGYETISDYLSEIAAEIVPEVENPYRDIYNLNGRDLYLRCSDGLYHHCVFEKQMQ